MTADDFSSPTRNTGGRIRTQPTKLDWSVAASIALMLAMVLAVAFGDAGHATAYAAVPM